MRSQIATVSILILCSIGSIPVLADYPVRPLRIIVPLPSGGPSDAAARMLAQPLSKAIGQPIIIDNRPGADGAIAAQAALAAAPDGYTLLWVIGSMAALPLVQKSPPFQSLGELAPVSLIGRFAFALFVHPGVPASSLPELVQHARANPGKLAFASATLGEFMMVAQFMKATGIEMLRVPYKGAAQAMPDVLAGRVQVCVTPIQFGIPHARDGKLRALASVSHRRTAIAPDLPTLIELGVQGVSTPTWQAILAPLKTPSGIIKKLSTHVVELLHDSGLRSRFEQHALLVEAMGPDELKSLLGQDFASWRRFVREYDLPKE